MLHPATKLTFINEAIGYGVVATEFIPRGTIVWVRDELDQRLTREQFQSLGPLYEESLLKYLYVDSAGLYVLCWDIARYINHSCESSCLPAGFDGFELAVRDIHPGEELTDDYGTLAIQFSFECHCGSPKCRGLIDPADFPKYASAWHERSKQAFSAIRDVPQPMWSLVQEKESIDQILRQERPYRGFLGAGA
jgi:uncharacterized protein